MVVSSKISEELDKSKIANKIILLGQFGLGDTMLLCGFKDALEKYYNAPVHFIIKPTHQVVMKMYRIEDYSVKVFEEDELREFVNKNSKVKIGEYFVAHPNYLNDDYKLVNEFLNFKMSFFDVFKKTLGLPDDARFEYPTTAPVISELLKRKIEKIAPLEKIVLISPEAFSTNKIIPEPLEAEVKKFTNNGYKVISNVINENNKIKGSIYVPMTVEDAIALAINCHHVISVRSGFCDLIAPFLRKMTVYYPDIRTYKLYSFSYLNNKEIEEIIAPDYRLKKIGPCLQLEQRNDEMLFRFCITLFRKKERKDSIKYCIFGIQIWVVKKFRKCRLHHLFGLIPIYKEISR